MTGLLIALTLFACGPKTPPAPPAPPADPLAERPEVPPAADWSAPVASVVEDAGPAEVWWIERPDLPLVSVRLWVPGGALAGPADHPGLVTLTDHLLLFGAGDRDAAAFAEYTEQLALSFHVSTTRRGTMIDLDCHADRLEEGVKLLADVVMRPRFEATDVARERDLQIAEIDRASDDPRTQAAWVAQAHWYGEGHPAAAPRLGTPAGLAELNASDVRKSWSDRATPSGARFVVTGAVSSASLQELLTAHFGDWSGPDTEPSALPAPSRTSGKHYIMVDTKGASQSVLRVLLPGHPAKAAETSAANLAAIVLGGTFTSRLNRLLREEKGYTYGARMGHSSNADDGMFVASTNVRADVTGAALADLLSELDAAREGLREAEYAKAVSASRTSAIEAVSTRSSLSDELMYVSADGFGPTALRDQLDRTQATEEQAVNDVMAQFMAGDMVIVVAGDLSVVREDVERSVSADWVIYSPDE